MDKTSYIVIGICCVILFAWEPLSRKIINNDETSQQQSEQTQSPTVTNALELVSTNTLENITNQVGQVETNTIAISTNSIVASTNTTSVIQSTNQVAPQPVFEETLFTLETSVANFEFSDKYGGLKRIYLNSHERLVTCDSSEEIASTNRVAINDFNNWELLGLENLQSDFGAQPGFQSQISDDKKTITFWKVLDNGLQIIQQFQVTTNDFEVLATVQFKNTSSQVPVKLPSTRRSIGSVTVNQSKEQDIDLRMIFKNGDKIEKIQPGWFDNKTLGCIPGTPRQQYYQTASSSMLWGGLANRFYAIIVEPFTSPSGIVGTRNYVTLPEKPDKSFNQLLGSFYYGEEIIDPNVVKERKFRIYAGPKYYNILKEFPNDQGKIADFGWFGFFSKGLLSAMNGLHSMGLSYALAILSITFVIKLLFWPLTHASTKSMKRMSKLQPQMKQIQEKYKEDPQKMQQKLMGFMKENKVNPMGGCLPMLFQMPVFIGFFYMIRTAIELRGESFLWACDLSESDTIATVMGFPINPMPILMGITMLVQARLTPPAAGVDPMQANMMRYMPLIFVAFLYNFSSALTMYWTFQNILSIVQTRLTKIDESALVPEKTNALAPSTSKKKKTKRPKNWLDAKAQAMKSAKNRKKGK